jgi:hypothetical protein
MKTRGKAGQFWARHAVGVILNGGGIVVAKIGIRKPNSDEITQSGERLLGFDLPNERLTHGSW